LELVEAKHPTRTACQPSPRKYKRRFFRPWMLAITVVLALVTAYHVMPPASTVSFLLGPVALVFAVWAMVILVFLSAWILLECVGGALRALLF
jgi:uncharacterized membrane protein